MPASFHALEHLQSTRELAAGEQKSIRGIDDLGLKLKQSFHFNFAEDQLLIFLFERDHVTNCVNMHYVAGLHPENARSTHSMKPISKDLRSSLVNADLAAAMPSAPP